MAEDYRGKFLALEREHNMLKHTVDYEREVEKTEHARQLQKLEDKVRFVQEESHQRSKAMMAE